MQGAEERTEAGEHAAQAGRVRLRADAPDVEDGADGAPGRGGWSPQGAVIAVVALLIMVGALVIILWGALYLKGG